jgi:biopolymer transport protein TolR
MARIFRRKHTAQPIADLNITNLVDLGFTLLIIFMICASYSQEEQTVPVNLPTVARTPQLKPDKNDRFVAIGVDAAGSYYVENETKSVTLAELRRRLKGYATETKQPVMRIRGDGSVPYEKVAQLFNEVERAGLVRFTIDSQVAP